jgi:glycosyltransferase involved in cell wall biosynthesis
VMSVTVVIPTYNRAALLDATLRAVLAQTVPLREVIVVDDGSTDDTATVCARYSEIVRYIRQENTGLPAYARNRGIAEATGDWIAFCDSDDRWRPHKLEIQLAAIASAGAEWSVAGFGLIDPDGTLIPSSGRGFAHEFPVFTQLRVTPNDHFSAWLAKTTVESPLGPVDVFGGDAFGMLFEGNVCLTSTAVVRRDLIARAGGYNPDFMAEDTEFFHRLAAAGRVAIVMNELIDYRVGHPSMMSARDVTPFVRSALRSIDLAARLRPALTPREERAYREGRSRLRIRLAYQRLSVLDRAGARQTVLDGWRRGELLSGRALAIVLASLIPSSGLRTLHAAKRGVGFALRRRGANRAQRAVRRRADKGSSVERAGGSGDGAAG